MSRTVALLRGINVGGHHRLRMALLREVLTELGGQDVRTHLQSGNVVCVWPDSPDELSRKLAAALEASVGFAVPVVVRSAAELDAVVAGMPFDPAGIDPKHLHVAFLAGEPDPTRLGAVDAQALLPDRFAVGKGVLYLHYADASKASPLSRLRLGVDWTARNWRTVLALQQLARG